MIVGMNLYAFLPLMAFFANILLGCYILYIAPKNTLNRLYTLLAFVVAIMALGEFLVLTSTTFEAALYWDKLTAVTSLGPALLLHFFLVFTKKELRKIYLIALYLPALFFAYIGLTTNLITETLELSSWGYGSVTGTIYPLFSFSLIGYVILGLLVCYRFYLRAPTTKEKLQAKFLIIAISVPLVGGVIIQRILPFLGFTMMPLSTTFTTFMAIIIAYTIVKYKLMTSVSFSIRNKLIALFLIVSILPVVITGVFFIGDSKDNLEKEIKAHLETAADSKAHTVETLLEQHKDLIELMSSETFFIELLNTSKDNSEYNKRLERVNERLNRILGVYGKIFKLFILDKNGIVVASTVETSVGSDKSADDIFLKGRESTYIKDIHVHRATGIPSIDIAAPIAMNGEFLGLIAADFDIASLDLFEILENRAGLGETGEVYLINKEGYMISPSRFREDVILKQRVDTENSRNCLGMRTNPEEHIGHEAIGIFPDYRGIRVLGTHVYISEMDWCLLAEIDETEAFASLIKMGTNMILNTLLFLILVVGLAFFFSRLITNPIKKLRKNIEDISMGRLEVEIDSKLKLSKDEIGKLARAFDRMIVSLKLAMKQTAPELKKESDVLRKALEEKEKAQKELRESEEKLNSIFGAADDGIIYIDTTGTIGEVNKKFEEIVGIKRDEIIGKNFIEIGLIDKNEIPRILKMFSDILTTGKSIKNFEITLKRKDGNIIHVETNTGFVKKDGKIVGISTILRDISERKKSAVEWEKKFDAISDLVFIIDKDLRLVRVNKAICDFLKKEPKDLIGKKCYEVIHGRNTPWLTCPAKKTLETGKVVTEEVNDPKIGIPFLITTSPIFDERGELTGCVHIAKVITSQEKKVLRRGKKKKDD